MDRSPRLPAFCARLRIASSRLHVYSLFLARISYRVTLSHSFATLTHSAHTLGLFHARSRVLPRMPRTRGSLTRTSLRTHRGCADLMVRAWIVRMLCVAFCHTSVVAGIRSSASRTAPPLTLFTRLPGSRTASSAVAQCASLGSGSDRIVRGSHSSHSFTLCIALAFVFFHSFSPFMVHSFQNMGLWIVQLAHALRTHARYALVFVAHRGLSFASFLRFVTLIAPRTAHSSSDHLASDRFGFASFVLSFFLCLISLDALVLDSRILAWFSLAHSLFLVFWIGSLSRARSRSTHTLGHTSFVSLGSLCTSFSVSRSWSCSFLLLDLRLVSFSDRLLDRGHSLSMVLHTHCTRIGSHHVHAPHTSRTLHTLLSRGSRTHAFSLPGSFAHSPRSPLRMDRIWTHVMVSFVCTFIAFPAHLFLVFSDRSHSLVLPLDLTRICVSSFVWSLSLGSPRIGSDHSFAPRIGCRFTSLRYVARLRVYVYLVTYAHTDHTSLSRALRSRTRFTLVLTSTSFTTFCSSHRGSHARMDRGSSWMDNITLWISFIVRFADHFFFFSHALSAASRLALFSGSRSSRIIGSGWMRSFAWIAHRTVRTGSFSAVYRTLRLRASAPSRLSHLALPLTTRSLRTRFAPAFLDSLFFAQVFCLVVCLAQFSWISLHRFCTLRSRIASRMVFVHLVRARSACRFSDHAVLISHARSHVSLDAFLHFRFLVLDHVYFHCAPHATRSDHVACAGSWIVFTVYTWLRGSSPGSRRGCARSLFADRCRSLPGLRFVCLDVTSRTFALFFLADHAVRSRIVRSSLRLRSAGHCAVLGCHHVYISHLFGCLWLRTGSASFASLAHTRIRVHSHLDTHTSHLVWLYVYLSDLTSFSLISRIFHLFSLFSGWFFGSGSDLSFGSRFWSRFTRFACFLFGSSPHFHSHLWISFRLTFQFCLCLIYLSLVFYAHLVALCTHLCLIGSVRARSHRSRICVRCTPRALFAHLTRRTHTGWITHSPRLDLCRLPRLPLAFFRSWISSRILPHTHLSARCRILALVCGYGLPHLDLRFARLVYAPHSRYSRLSLHVGSRFTPGSGSLVHSLFRSSAWILFTHHAGSRFLDLPRTFMVCHWISLVHIVLLSPGSLCLSHHSRVSRMRTRSDRIGSLLRRIVYGSVFYSAFTFTTHTFIPSLRLDLICRSAPRSFTHLPHTHAAAVFFHSHRLHLGSLRTSFLAHSSGLHILPRGSSFAHSHAHPRTFRTTAPGLLLDHPRVYHFWSAHGLRSLHWIGLTGSVLWITLSRLRISWSAHGCTH